MTLSVQFPATYPKTIPILKIKDLQSGNPNVPSRLQNVIEAEPKARLGCEMIYDIILELQEILDDAANLKAGNEGLHSLEAERAAREADQERRTLEREQDLLRQVEDERAKEDRMIADQVEMERQKQRLALRPSAQEHITGEFLSQAPGGLDLSITSFDQPMTTKDAKDNDTFTFRSVWGRFNLLKARDKKITIVSPLTDHDVMVPQLLLKDIYLIEKSSESNNFRREMQVIEELLEASKIHRHVNVVDLLGYKIQRVPAGAASPPDVAATWELSILSEWANKGSLQELLELTGGLKAQQVRSWTHQILDALEFFDQNGYVHPALHAGNVLLFRSRTGEIHVKLSDGYGTALKTLVMLAKEQAGITQRTSPNWTAPELLAKSPQRTSKTCIWDLGVLILQMIFGADVAEVQYASPKQCIDGTDMSHALEDFIRKVLQTEPSRRPRAFDLSSFAFFQRQDEELLYSGSPLAPSTPYRRTRPSSSSALQTMSNFFFSRFEKEYEFVGKLGKGGFGEVVKARNRMDGEVYAIKKIFCESSEALAAMVSETKLLARLNHPFVVRYYGSWDEKEQLPEDAISSTTSQEAIASFDNDPFAVSSFGHDFMSSSNYRNIGIQFGDSDDDDEEDEEGRDALDAPESPQDQASKNFSTVEEADTREAINSQTQSQPLARRTSRFWQARPQKTTLYIQMEYCENRTLRHLIKDGLYNDTDKSWRLFHQILNGLAHIHANGIVHRDLKPDNIFISKEGYPRIGDFGLATTGLVTASARGSDALVAGPETRSIGTTYYVAPELGSKGSGKYSSKVDMYSLGIILFEMCHPLETSMERDRQLSQLREEHPTLPPTFQGPKLIVQGPTILRLLNHNQHERPSAAELLQTGHVSEPLEQEKIERYLDTIAGANPAVYEKALSSFFSRPTKKHVDLAWHDKTQGAANLAASLLAMSVKDSVISVFRRHGAVENDRQTILPRTDHYADCKPEAATFLDRSGMVVLLPYDLTMPFARSLGSTKLEYQKVFSIGEVFRRNHAPGLEPIGYPEVDFDIVSYNAIDLTLKEAEVIKVLDEIILELPGLRSKLISIHINHSDLLDMILEVCRIKPTQYDKVKSILAELNMDATTWTRIRAELRSDTINVPATSLDDLARFNFRDNLDGASRKLEALFEGTIYAGRLAQILARIESVMTFLVRFNVRSKVYIAPLSTNGDKTYHGSLLIQCMNESRKKRLAAGGRYDSIIAEYQPRGIAAQARAVGFRLNLGELVLSLTSEAKKPSAAKLKSGPTFSPTLTTRRCEVLLTSPDGNIRRGTCVELISRLWANGISAELTEDFASMEELESAYHRDPHTFVVTVRYDSGAIGERSIKARNISKKEDTEVLATDLVNWIKGEIRERKHREGERQDAGTKLKREISMNESSALVGESREPDVLVLSPLHRGKKTNRRQIIDAAGTKTRELATSMLTDAPIVAIETSDEIIDFMRNTRLSDPESWRNLTQSAPLQERKYLQQVQEMLQEVATEGKRGAFVFNYRTRACIYYDLGKVN